MPNAMTIKEDKFCSHRNVISKFSDNEIQRHKTGSLIIESNLFIIPQEFRIFLDIDPISKKVLEDEEYKKFRCDVRVNGCNVCFVQLLKETIGVLLESREVRRILELAKDSLSSEPDRPLYMKHISFTCRQQGSNLHLVEHLSQTGIIIVGDVLMSPSNMTRYFSVSGGEAPEALQRIKVEVCSYCYKKVLTQINNIIDATLIKMSDPSIDMHDPEKSLAYPIFTQMKK